MPLKRINSRDNPVFAGLKGVAHSRRQRREQGVCLLDGEHLLEEALRVGLAPLRIIVSEGYEKTATWVQRVPGVPAIELPASLFAALSPVETPSGIMALIPIPRSKAVAAECIVLLEKIQDPGNLGGLLRTAAAAGVQAAYLSPGCAEAWSPKALRGGQGAQFRLAVVEHADLVEVVQGFQGRVLAAVLGARDSLYDLDLTGPVAFAFGNEGAGLGNALQEVARAFSIPMPGGIESLNVAASAAVCLFERVRQLGGHGLPG